jgi:S-adenosylmethionine hydrolase
LPAKIVTLTSDFGLRDPYVAEMKAVILSICPDAVIVDITHDIEKFDVRMGAFMLSSAAPYFPKGTIHVAVVDPVVGTQRRAILIQTRQGFFVGPDNGLLILPAVKQAILAVHELTNPKLMRSAVSSTFHGRDIFAPASAHLANGVPPSGFGPEVSDVVKPTFARVAVGKGIAVGEVLHVDDFGNVITNVSSRDITHLDAVGWIAAELPNGKLKLRFVNTYAEAKPNEALALIGSHGYVELAVNQGNASETLKIKAGDKVKLALAK